MPVGVLVHSETRKADRHLLFAAVAALLLTIFGAGPFCSAAKAQFTVGIGAQREPRLSVDQNNNLFLVMAVATKPASAGTPGSQIMFTESTNGGTTWDNMPVTRNLTNSEINGIGALFPRIAITRTGRTRRSGRASRSPTAG